MMMPQTVRVFQPLLFATMNTAINKCLQKILGKQIHVAKALYTW